MLVKRTFWSEYYEALYWILGGSIIATAFCVLVALGLIFGFQWMFSYA